MDTLTAVVYLASVAVSLAVLFFIVRAAVLSAMKAHTVWASTDGPARDAAARAARAARPASSVNLGTAPRD